MNFTATEINYYHICHRKLWWFHHHISMEHESDRVLQGKLIHQESYARQKKEIDISTGSIHNIDGKVVFDFASRDGVIHEVKKSRAMEQADEWQTLYYLYVMKQKGVTHLVGEIDYPRLKKTKRVTLTPEKEAELKRHLADMNRIIALETPPPITVSKSLCKKCAYFELCYA